jgi:diaminopropionate ammonia-lyase
MLIRNRNANKAASWTPEQDAILSDAAYRNAAKVITAWDGYAVTPLHVLSDLAKEAGVGRIHYKDEAERFGLDSFKALGGAYAVARLAADAEASLTVCCATDGNHGRSVAWGARLFGCKAVIFRPCSGLEGP